MGVRSHWMVAGRMALREVRQKRYWRTKEEGRKHQAHQIEARVNKVGPLTRVVPEAWPVSHGALVAVCLHPGGMYCLPSPLWTRYGSRLARVPVGWLRFLILLQIEFSPLPSTPPALHDPTHPTIDRHAVLLTCVSPQSRATPVLRHKTCQTLLAISSLSQTLRSGTFVDGTCLGGQGRCPPTSVTLAVGFSRLFCFIVSEPSYLCAAPPLWSHMFSLWRGAWQQVDVMWLEVM